jgi:3-oxoacyl-[acyl-carrier-protein] synthase II
LPTRSATDAIGLGAQWIARRRCDVVLAGGADALHRVPYLGFGVLRNTSTTDCQPFDRNRAGLNLGEGAGVLVLEHEDHARRRGADLLGWIAGHATASDAHHPTAPHPEGRGLRRALAAALTVAELSPAAVGFVHAHGTGTVHNDRVEGKALADLFGPDAVVFSTKGATGHTMGAAGALGAIFALAHLRDGQVPPSAGFRTPDPECVVVPTTEVRRVTARAAVSSSLAFGGTNSVLVLRRGEPRHGARS